MRQVRSTAYMGAMIGLAVLVASAADAQAQAATRITFVQNNAVCTVGASAVQRCLAASNLRVRLPVWSRDGNRIAYIEDTNSDRALSTLVVSDPFGQVLARVPLKPVARNEVRSGMRQVESIEWLTSDQIVVSGTINPSSTEHLVVNLLQLAVTSEYVDDGQGAAFSPDGKHVAVIEGAPHFASVSGRAPVLMVDGREVFTKFDADASNLGRPVWSADSSTVAVPLRNDSGKQGVVYLNIHNAASRWVDLPFADQGRNGGAAAVFWSGGALHVQRKASVVPSKLGMGQSSAPDAASTGPGAAVTAVQDWTLQVSRTAAGWRQVQTPAVNPELAAQALRRQAAATRLPANARDVDVWCAACALDLVARRSGAAHDWPQR